MRRTEAAIGKLADLRREYIFVDDNSTDNSVEILKELQATHPISIIRMSRNFGYTPCVLAGFSRAKGDAVVYMDADLQDPPEIIPEMVERFQAGADVVHTTRTRREGEGLLKVWSTRIAYRVINYFSDIQLPENSGDFKLLSRKVVDEITRLREVDPYMRGLSVWVGYRQEFVYYNREKRWRGTTKFPLFSKGPMNEFVRGLTAFSAAPLYISFFLGTLTTFLAAILIAYAAVTKLLGTATPGISGVLVAVAFFGGVVLMTNGIIGLYVARIYYETKRRPRYVIREVLDYKKGALEGP